MREIKFRVWFKGVKKLIYFENPIIGMDGEGKWGIHMPAIGGTVFMDANITEQFTGLHDKNGKEIYEADICKCLNENYIGSVSFKGGCFVTDCEGWGEVCLSGANLEDIEVIGNIHEDSHLLDNEAE
jgi:hypothetical protein